MKNKKRKILIDRPIFICKQIIILITFSNTYWQYWGKNVFSK